MDNAYESLEVGKDKSKTQRAQRNTENHSKDKNVAGGDKAGTTSVAERNIQKLSETDLFNLCVKGQDLFSLS
jgi:hypothetical protein